MVPTLPQKNTMDKNWKDWLGDGSKYLLVVLVILFISMLFPKNPGFKYEFRLNQPWGYDELISEYDFPLLKTKSELEEEKAKLIEEFPPYFTISQVATEGILTKYDETFSAQIGDERLASKFEDVPSRPGIYHKEGRRILSNVLKNGVAVLNEEQEQLPSSALVYIVDGDTKTKTTKQSLLTPEKAKEMASDSLFESSLKEAYFLIKVINEAVGPNLEYDEAATKKFLDLRLADVSEGQGFIKQGTLLIRKGEPVTPTKYREISSYKSEYELRSGNSGKGWVVFIGYLFLTTMIIGMLLLYLQFHAPEVYSSFMRMLAIFIWPVIFSFLVYIIEGTGNLSSYLIPFCIAPIVINHFFNARLALFVHIVIILIASFLSSLGYEFTFLQILAGIVAIFTNLKSGTLVGFFRTMIFIFITYSIGFISLSLVGEGSFTAIEWGTLGWAFLNAILTMLAFPMVPLLEKLFGFTTKVTLDELSDMNLPLLRDLSIKAPGTLQHSMQVGNLAEAAANAIGANAQLIKVAALYHDIGKTAKPEYYIENQKGSNPHDELPHLESAKIIIEHVTEGMKMAKKAKLPMLLTDFIITHHGTTRVEYFYRQHMNENPDSDVDESVFRYPGPNPTTKEQTILMVADSLEAASKSLKNPSQEDIENLVENIIKGKMTQGQFDQSELSFEELETCKKVFKTTLGSIHHVRIQYPELKNKKS